MTSSHVVIGDATQAVPARAEARDGADGTGGHAMSKPLSDRERLARELCRWDEVTPRFTNAWEYQPSQERRLYRREADRVIRLLGKGKKP
jgi:hypothetical protein